MSGVKWIVSLGQEAAVRTAAGTILAVAATGMPVTVELLGSGEKGTPARSGDRLHGLVDRPIDYDKVVLQLDPEAWPQLCAREAGSYVIGAASWETNTLPEEWVASCNVVDEVWVPSAWDADVFAGSGVESPLTAIPPCRPDLQGSGDDPARIGGLGDGPWVFYSIADWSERSNPRDLVLAYLAAFSRVRGVVLALAVTNLQDRDEEFLRRRIGELKREIQLPHYAKILVLVSGSDRAQIRALHLRGDCFAQLSRGGGWDAERFEAVARGKPVLASRFGGSEDYLSEDTAYPVSVTLRPVENMQPSPLYLGTQLWAQPDVEQAARLMRRVYDDREEARRKGALAGARLAERYAPEIVASRVVTRFEEIGS